MPVHFGDVVAARAAIYNGANPLEVRKLLLSIDDGAAKELIPALEEGAFLEGKSARQCRQQVDRYLFLRTESVYINLLKQIKGLEPAKIVAARRRQMEESYQNRLGAYLVEVGALSSALDKGIVKRVQSALDSEHEKIVDRLRTNQYFDIDGMPQQVKESFDANPELRVSKIVEGPEADRMLADIRAQFVDDDDEADDDEADDDDEQESEEAAETSDGFGDYDAPMAAISEEAAFAPTIDMSSSAPPEQTSDAAVEEASSNYQLPDMDPQDDQATIALSPDAVAKAKEQARREFEAEQAEDAERAAKTKRDEEAAKTKQDEDAEDYELPPMQQSEGGQATIDISPEEVAAAKEQARREAEAAEGEGFDYELPPMQQPEGGQATIDISPEEVAAAKEQARREAETGGDGFDYQMPAAAAGNEQATISVSAEEAAEAALGDPLAGTGLKERYQILEKLGQGAMGAVYLATDKEMGQPVALKLILKKELENSKGDAVQRFKREILCTSFFWHENLVEIHDGGSTDDGSFYMVMEYIDGAPLSSVLKAEGPLPLIRCINLFIQVLEAMQAAHDAKIIHRDLKPENFMHYYDDDDKERIKVMDFGIARILDKDQEFSNQFFQTMVGTLTGSPAYVAPESIVAPDVDHLADIYSLGIILYELSVGNVPFRAKTAQEYLPMQLYATPPDPQEAAPHRGIPDSLKELMLWMLTKLAEERPESCNVVLGVLRDKVIPELEGKSASRETNKVNREDMILGVETPTADEGQDDSEPGPTKRQTGWFGRLKKKITGESRGPADETSPGDS